MPNGVEDGPLGPSLIVELLDRYAPALELYASQWTNAPADCVQEAFVTLARLLQQSGTRPQNPTAWLFHAVRNQALNAARADRRREHHERVAATLHERLQQGQAPADEQVQIVEALDLLQPDERELVVLRIWSELTWQEIADIVETSSSSAQRRYVAVLSKLQKHLEATCLPSPNCPPN